MFLESLLLYVKLNIRRHLIKYDELLFSFKNLSKFHCPLNLQDCE